MGKTFEEINEKIRKGEVVVATAEEIIDIVKEKGIKEAARKVDVVTTATFGPMCSSGAFVNFGHSDPPIRMNKVWLNDVPAYGGIAAVDAYRGYRTVGEQGPGIWRAHVIEDLVAGKKVRLKAKSYGTDCYPRLDIDTDITLKDLNQAYLFNPRNVYQNYSAATNTSDQIIDTYMGTLLPRCGNVTYSTSGELSPLLNDPEFRTIGIGTRIFLAGTQGYVAWEGTQFVRNKVEIEDGITMYSGGTLAVIGDLKEMNTRYLRAASFARYGTTMFVGIGIPIPVLDEEMMEYLAVTNREIYTGVVDYSVPSRSRPTLSRVSYEELRSGSIELEGKKVPTAPLSSLNRAREIANVLKESIERGEFFLQEPVQMMPTNREFKPLKDVGVE